MPGIKGLSYYFIALLIVGLVARIAVAAYSFQFRENTDVLRYRDWATIAYLHGPEKTYENTYLTFGTLPNNQPPGSLYILSGSYYANLQAAKLVLKVAGEKENVTQFINGALMNFFMRLPSLLSDLLLATLIYLVIKQRKKEKLAIIGSSLFLFNPVVIYNSSFWGQMDAVNNLFFYLSLFFLTRKAYFKTIVFLSLSLLVKFSLLFFLPILLLIVYKKINNAKRFSVYIIASLIIITILTLPISLTPHTWLMDFFIKNTFGEIQNVTAFAFNFWWMVFKPFIAIGEPSSLFSFSEVRLLDAPLDSEKLFGAPLSIMAGLLFILLLIPLIRKFIKQLSQKSLPTENLFLLSATTSLLAFLFLPGMHERYVYPVFPLLATYVGLKQKFIVPFILLSILNLVNLYLVWHPMMLSFFPYYVMNNQTFQWTISLLIVGTGLYLYIRSLRTL